MDYRQCLGSKRVLGPMYTTGQQLSVNERSYLIPSPSQALVQESLVPICTGERPLFVQDQLSG